MRGNKLLYKINKLIRDKLPDYMRGNHIIPKIYTLNNEQLKKQLQEKLIEEVEEVRSADDKLSLTQELADLLEVMQCIAKNNEIEWQEIENTAFKKVERFGGFKEGVFCELVEVEPNSSCENYYAKSPDKYPQLMPCQLNGLYLISENKHPPAVKERIAYGIREYNIPYFGFQAPSKPFCLYIQDEKNEVVAGLYGSIWNHFSYIDVLWVSEGYRNKGIGTFLMGRTEAFLKNHGCKKIRLDTFDFQAPQFYEKLGFKNFGIIPSCIRGRTRFYMEKILEI